MWAIELSSRVSGAPLLALRRFVGQWGHFGWTVFFGPVQLKLTTGKHAWLGRWNSAPGTELGAAKDPSHKRRRILYRSPGVLNTWCFAGTLGHRTDIGDAGYGLLNMIASDVVELGDGEELVLEVKRMDMTDAAVGALPDL